MAVRHARIDADRTAPEQPEDDRRAETDFALAHGLAGYVRAVAGLLHVGSEATACEVSDTATAYLALNARSSVHPDRDLMLVWTERQGWALAVETAPGEAPVMLTSLGSDLVPEPAEVARFVDSALAGRSPPNHVPPRSAISRQDVGMRLTRYVEARS
jgi:hypothetical protein